MAEIRTVTTLARKRAEIKTAIARYEKALAQAKADLAHIKAAITIFQIEGVPEGNTKLHRFEASISLPRTLDSGTTETSTRPSNNPGDRALRDGAKATRHWRFCFGEGDQFPRRAGNGEPSHEGQHQKPRQGEGPPNLATARHIGLKLRNRMVPAIVGAVV
jgi:hypothetical protein